MKVILCTGDSHTCGEKAEGFCCEDITVYGFCYNPKGKGTGRYNRFDGKCYVNLVRDFVTENTSSSVENVDISSIGEDVYGNRKIENGFSLDCNCDMLLLKVAEKKEYAAINIYLDGELARRVILKADVTRYGEWSYRDIKINCKGKKTVHIEIAAGEVYISSIERWSGAYAVVNCGVGSCDTTRYLNEYMQYWIEEFSPYMFLAEAHTINDWLASKTPEKYGEDLTELIKMMKCGAEKVIMTTVSPVIDGKWRGKAAGFDGPVVDYEELIKESYRIIEREGVLLADGHKVIKDACGDMCEEELRKELYNDSWHVNTNGHKLYADVICQELKKIL